MPKKVFFVLGAILLAIQIKNFYTTNESSNDLRRSQEAVSAILQQANNHSFALTFLSKRSPSDAHLRYLLTLKNIEIKKINDRSIDYLFLVYENDDFNPEPSSDAIIIDSECLPECPSFNKQKKVELREWNLIKRTDFKWGAVITYRGKLTPIP